MKKILLSLLLFTTLQLAAQSPSLVWAHAYNSYSTDNAFYLKTCPNGDIVVYGNSNGYCDFEPSYYYTYTLQAPSNFLVRYTKDSTLLWVKKLWPVNANDMATDSQGNTYLAGNFSGTVDFDPGPSIFNLTGTGDCFITKFDASGNFVNAFSIGGSGGEDLVSIQIDNNDNIVLTGRFQGTVDFDHGAGIANLTAPSTYGYFCAKYSPAMMYLNAIAIGPTTASTCDINTVKFDGTNNYFLIGEFNAAMDMDPGAGTFSLTPTGGTDVFVLKLDSTLTFINAEKIGGTASETYRGSAIDNTGNLVLTGTFYVTTDFDPGPGTFNLNTAGSQDVYVATYSTSTLSFMNAFSLGNSGVNSAYGLVIDASNKICLLIAFTGTIDADPGAGIFNVTTAGSGEFFMGKYLNDGTFQWAFTLTGSAGVSAGMLDITADDRIYLCGWHTGTIDFDPSATNYTNSAPTFQSDGYIAKYIDCGPDITNISDTICFGESYFLSPNYYTETGIYKQDYPDSDGCDSIVNLQLYVQQVESHLCAGTNMLIAETNGTGLQWYNCSAGTIVSGATNDTLLTSSFNLYSLISSLGGCADTSECISLTGNLINTVPQLDWAYNMEIEHFYHHDNGIFITKNDDVLVSGDFTYTKDFDLGPDSTFMTSDNNSIDLMLARYGSNSAFQWAFRAGTYSGGAYWERIYSVATDEEGDIFVCGGAFGNFDIDPSSAVTTLPGGAFFAKFNATGQFLWAKSLPSLVIPYTMILDHNNNIIIGGDFTGTVDMNPGAGVNNLTPTGGSETAFVAKYDPNGNYLWAFAFGGSTFTDDNTVRSLAVDSKNNILVTGQFAGTADFNPGAGIFNLVSASTTEDLVLAKYGPNMSFKWALKKGGASDDLGKSVVVDCYDNVFVAGDAGTMLVSKHDSTGAFLFNLPISGTNKAMGKLCIDPNNNIYVSGYFGSTINMGGPTTLTAAGTNDIVVAKYKNDGSFQWQMKLGGSSDDQSRNIAIDSKGDLYLTGYTYGNIDMDPSAGIYNLTGPGAPARMFIAKYGTSCPAINAALVNAGSYLTCTEDSVGYQWFNCSSNLPIAGATGQIFYPTVSGDYYVVINRGTCVDTSVCETVVTSSIETISHPSASVSPNPTTGSFIIASEESILQMEITNILGQTIYSSIPNSEKIEVDIGAQPTGIYFVKVKMENGIGIKKIIKQ